VHYVYHAPVSQRELFAMYADFDALVLPTIFEGFGLVIVEAMAAGLPCITTAHSIGPDLIRTGDNGYIVPIRDVTAIVDAVSILLDTDDDAYLGLCRRAREAALGFTWGAHRDNLSRLLDRIEN
jgi:glycosyltransferase involved in cell wall biosynthesis